MKMNLIQIAYFPEEVNEKKEEQRIAYDYPIFDKTQKKIVRKKRSM